MLIRSFRLLATPYALAACLAVVGCTDARESATAPTPPPSASLVDAELQDALASAEPDAALEVLVVYDSSAATGDQIQEAVLATGAGAIGFRHLPIVAALATSDQVRAIGSIAAVRGVFLAGLEQPLNAEAVTSVRADEVYAMRSGGQPIDGRGIGIAILDTGVDATHPDLALGSKVVQNVHTLGHTTDFYEFAGKDTLTGIKTPKPLKKGADLWLAQVPNTDISSSGHGTHVAATTAASGAASGGRYAGVAPGAHLVGINAATPAGFPTLLILAGFDYILEHRRDYNIQVVNNSWGSAGAYNPNDAIPVATRVLHGAGITVVFAAGNNGPKQNTMNRRSVAPWVISVAAACKRGGDPVWVNGYCRDDVVGPLRFRADDGRDGLLTYFSSRGVPGDPIQHPDILAPGARIVSARASNAAGLAGHEAGFINVGTCPELADAVRYACVSGTSMAAPVLTGIIALLEQASGGRITPDETLEILMSTAQAMPGYAFWEVGAGYVDAKAAVEATLSRYP